MASKRKKGARWEFVIKRAGLLEKGAAGFSLFKNASNPLSFAG